jgi:predicted DNA-binding ribbon-helix-helix protein
MEKPQKRSIVIAGHATSLSLEPVFWQTLREMATQQQQSLPEIIAEIDAAERPASLSSALRVAALTWALTSAHTQPRP